MQGLSMSYICIREFSSFIQNKTSNQKQIICKSIFVKNTFYSLRELTIWYAHAQLKESNIQNRFAALYQV